MVIATFKPIKVVFWPHGLVVMTPDFESGNRGSNPCGTFKGKPLTPFTYKCINSKYYLIELSGS